MTRQEEKSITKKRILAASVKLFLQFGYYKTTLSAIAKEAGVSLSSFQNIFGTKDGVLLDLAAIMFDSQFAAAKTLHTEKLKPICLYAVETAIQITLTELNESLREVYVEAYSNPTAAEYLHRRTTDELRQIFCLYNPDFTESDFYETEIGSSGIMRNYMARPCDPYFTLERKLSRFLSMSLKAYNVPQNEIDEAIALVLGMDIKEAAHRILRGLFEELSVRFDMSQIHKDK